MTGNTKFERILDKLIFGFIVIFLLTLHNSIFLNQIGYYGALVLMLIKGAYLRRNPFNRNGLEWFFLLFIIAELISAVLSVNQANAFENVLKRILLIPIVYVISAAAGTKEKAVTFFKIYITAAFVTLVIYIIFAYEHFINQLYQLETRGPSPFQYVMTAGGLISFSVVFLFAFFINEKSGWKNRLLIFSGFFLSLLALAASYTRAAWIGAAAGIFIILILKRKWIIIIPVLLITGGFLLYQKTSTIFLIQDANENSVTRTIEYPGKIYSVFPDGEELYFSAYKDGVLQYQSYALVPVIKPPVPVTFFSKWKEDLYFSFLIDQRFEIYKKKDGKFKKINELISPGFTSNYILNNDMLYISAQDSGLSIFANPMDSHKIFRYPEFGKVMRLAVSPSYLATFSFGGLFQIFTLKDGLPAEKIFSRNIKSNFGFTAIIDNHIFFATEKKTELLSVENNIVFSRDVNRELKNLNSFSFSNGRLFASGFTKQFFELEYPISNKINIIKRGELSFTPSSFTLQDNKFYYSNLKISRVNSIFDPYHFTNIERLYQWRAGIAILKDHPFFGVGDIDMKEVYKNYKNYYEKETYGHLHNNYIQLLAALGLFGFITVMLLLMKVLLIHLRINQTLSSFKFASSYSLGAVGTFVAFLISGLAEWNFGDHEIITMIWFILGLNLAFYRTFFQIQEPVSKKENIVG